MNETNLHEYQHEAINFILEKKKCGLFIDMGFGKTVISLTAATYFLKEKSVNKVLIIAPLRVTNGVWRQEANKWEHLKNYKFALASGTIKKRTLALHSKSDFYLINKENVPWMVDNFSDDWIWDMIIVDESSTFKNPRAKRFKALRKIIKYTKSIVIMSGTPSPNSYLDLWSQIYLIDQGKRLGRTFTQFCDRFFHYNPNNYQYTLCLFASNSIKKLIKDVIISFDKSKFLKLPDKINIKEFIDLPQLVFNKYKKLEREFICQLENDICVDAVSAATLINKLLQFTNGAIYYAERNYYVIHDMKINALKEIIESNSNENFLIAYNFRSDLERLQKHFPDAQTLGHDPKQIEIWNEGKIKILFAHPASAAHGLNLQFGGSVVVWFGLNWSLELYDQFNARLLRSGQTNVVRVIHLIGKNTIDEKVMLALNNKANLQNELLDYLKK